MADITGQLNMAPPRYSETPLSVPETYSPGVQAGPRLQMPETTTASPIKTASTSGNIADMATAAVPVANVATSALAAVLNVADYITSRKETEEARAEAQRQYEASLKLAAQQYQDKKEMDMRAMNLTEEQWRSQQKTLRNAEKIQQDNRNIQLSQGYMDKVLGILNDPSAKNNFMSVMKPSTSPAMIKGA
jgi:hypothetical protein